MDREEGSEEGLGVKLTVLQHDKTDQTSLLCIILHMLKSADKLPLFILLLVAMVAIFVHCSQEKQYFQTLTGGPESSKQRSSDKKIV